MNIYPHLLQFCTVPNKNKKFCKEGYPVIVMDFLEGGDLFNMVINRIKKEQPVNEKFLAPAFRSAMESLLSIHNSNFLHRDLKLDNMVLSSTADDAVVKIIDCGYFCHAPLGVVRETHLVGSPGYFAPETLQASSGRREYSTKTDVWQAGCALYIMLSGRWVCGWVGRK
jgi:calcium-dependent protein kinase